ncbi:hypothetical protein CMO91_04870 [Candidatus Woesearchaeota archaeon]|jgi:hypothetical protein|nr:hypothetical protein [Candidatus Woesearchaeota archaeon]|tara:strand:- start:575 stop:862 length:288 start_codon:yes stop_codon:yes gene_type:complete
MDVEDELLAMYFEMEAELEADRYLRMEEQALQDLIWVHMYSWQERVDFLNIGWTDESGEQENLYYFEGHGGCCIRPIKEVTQAFFDHFGPTAEYN